MDSVRYKTMGKPFWVGYNAKMNMVSGSRILIDLFGEWIIPKKFLRPEGDTHTKQMEKSSIQKNICVPETMRDELSIGVFIVT